MYAIGQIRFQKTEDENHQHLTFQVANKDFMLFKYHTEFHKNEYWNFRNFATLLKSKDDKDYGFYLILE